ERILLHDIGAAPLPYTLICCQGRSRRLGSPDHSDRPDNQTRTAMGEQRLWEKSYPPGVRWDVPVATAPLPRLFDEATATWGVKTGLEYRDTAISFTELRQTVDALAASFLQHDIGPGSTVALYL